MKNFYKIIKFILLTMTDSKTTLFINKDASSIKNLFLNHNWNIKCIYENIYTIEIENKQIDWIIKIYEKGRFAKKEALNLEILKDVKGIPKLLISKCNDHINYNIISKAPGIDLFEYVNKYGIINENKVKNITKKILNILNEIHKKNIIHQDIKLENILYDNKTEEVTLIDFEEKHTIDYWSPEQIKKTNEITTKTDIWSLGVCIFGMLTRECPFGNSKDILHCKYIFPDKIYDILRSKND